MDRYRVDMKIVLLGHGAVGKTSIMERFINEKFNETLPYQNTIGTAFAAKEVFIGKTELVLGIWDTAGSERYDSMTRVYYRGAKAAIVCYDITSKTAFNRAKHWIRELRTVEENCKIYICATKTDLLDLGQEATPSLDAVCSYTSGIQAKLFLTSSKTGENILEMFHEIASDFLAQPGNREKLEAELIHLAPNRKGSSCCAFGNRR